MDILGPSMIGRSTDIVIRRYQNGWTIGHDTQFWERNGVSSTRLVGETNVLPASGIKIWMSLDKPRWII
jgi:hypothetical protein